ncbi:MAG: transketolase [Clostridia bacterium]
MIPSDLIKEIALNMRKNIIELGYLAENNGAHFGSALSIVDIMATLYSTILNNENNKRDFSDQHKLILSKGHGSLGLYTALYEGKIISLKDLNSFESEDGDFPGQPVMNILKGIEYSSGSLGHGLSYGVGLSLANKKKKRDSKIFVILGDGECNEGTIWEAAMSAAHFKLDNLIVIIDCNKLQSDGPNEKILHMGNMASKWESFGWFVFDNIDGHDIDQLYITTINSGVKEGFPTVILANTIKGKGISFMENNNEWHHNVLTEEKYKIAMGELNAIH